MIKDNSLYLKLILNSIVKIQKYVRNFDFSDFKKDEKTQSAVLMQFQIIGELSKKINKETKQDIDLPWKEIAGFRDIISHDYFSIDVSFVWETVSQDIPKLKKEITKFFKNKKL